MKVRTKAAAAFLALAGAGTVITVFNNPDVMRGFINGPFGAQQGNYDDGPERVTVRVTWGHGQFAYVSIYVNGNPYYRNKRDALEDKGGRAPTWTLRPSKGDKIEVSIIPGMVDTGSSCSITDPKHPEAVRPPAVTASYTGKSACEYTVLG